MRVPANLGANEWRSHVDQVATSKRSIEKVLGDTQADLSIVSRTVGEEIARAQTKEKYLNHQFNHLATAYGEHKRALEELERGRDSTNEKVSKLTNDLAELTDKLDEIKESFESKDSGMHDQSFGADESCASADQARVICFRSAHRCSLSQLVGSPYSTKQSASCAQRPKIKARHAKKKEVNIVIVIMGISLTRTKCCSILHFVVP